MEVSSLYRTHCIQCQNENILQIPAHIASPADPKYKILQNSAFLRMLNRLAEPHLHNSQLHLDLKWPPRA